MTREYINKHKTSGSKKNELIKIVEQFPWDPRKCRKHLKPRIMHMVRLMRGAGEWPMLSNWIIHYPWPKC